MDWLEHGTVGPEHEPLPGADASQPREGSDGVLRTQRLELLLEQCGWDQSSASWTAKNSPVAWWRPVFRAAYAPRFWGWMRISTAQRLRPQAVVEELADRRQAVAVGHPVDESQALAVGLVTGEFAMIGAVQEQIGLDEVEVGRVLTPALVEEVRLVEQGQPCQEVMLEDAQAL